MPSHETKMMVLTIALGISLIISLFLVVGYFNQPSICMCGNVKTIQLNSAFLYSAILPIAPTCSSTNGANFTMSLNDPWTTTSITSFTLTGSSLNNTTVTVYYLGGSGCLPISSTHRPTVDGGNVTTITLYFGAVPASALAKNQTFNYVLGFANGESISGSLLAQ